VLAYAFVKGSEAMGLPMPRRPLFLLAGAMALTTYVGRIAPASEYTPTLSMGVAMTHVAAVTMPIVGGLLWEAWGYKWTFLIGAAAAAGSIPVVMRLPRKAPPEPAPAAAGEPAERVEAK